MHARSIVRTVALVAALMSAQTALPGDADAQVTIEQVGFFTRPLVSPAAIFNGIWGFAKNGEEYALVCSSMGLSIVRVTDPASLVEVAFFEMPGGTYNRDVCTWGDYAYVGGQQDAPLYIIDISDPENASIYGTLSAYTDAAHTLNIEDGILYLNSANHPDFDRGLIMLDLSQAPQTISEIARYTGNDCHDSFVRGDLLVTAGGTQGDFHFVDISDPSVPVLLGETVEIPGTYAHSCWLSEDGNTLYGFEEFNQENLLVYDARDVTNPTYVTSVGTPKRVHNGMVYGSHLLVTYYIRGFKIFDIFDPHNPVPTFPPVRGAPHPGDWNIYHGLPSGRWLVTHTNDPGVPGGLYIYEVTIPLRANAGVDQAVPLQANVQLDGRNSDSPDTIVSWSWSQAGGPPVLLSGAGTPTPTFSASVPGVYSFYLTVGDGAATSNDQVSVYVGLTRPDSGGQPNEPARLTLAPAGPSPFRSSAQFALELSMSATVVGKVYDARGRSISTVVNREMAPGRHRLVWDGRRHRGRAASSGTYFLEVLHGNVRETQRFVLVR